MKYNNLWRKGIRDSLGIGKRKRLKCVLCKRIFLDSPYYWPIDGDLICYYCFYEGIIWAIKKSKEETQK